MQVDLLCAEIGSTTTVVNAFSGIGTAKPRLAGQGFAPTSVLEGDVTVGLNASISNLKKNLGCENLSWKRFLASSSAAGGLRMTVHGLVYDMTVRAAKEAALGAGANIHQITAGRMRRTELKKLVDVHPNIIMIAGGVDYGERDTALDNAEKIADLKLGIPVIYAGNIQNHEEIREIFRDSGSRLYIVDNVYPVIDRMEVLPARKVIQQVFEEHIVHAPGMEKIRSLVDGHVIPTPGAVMEATRFLNEELGDLITFDVGGATTDVHSVTEGSENISSIQIYPEPDAKRTVEGDLGVYINRMNVLELSDQKRLSRITGIEEEKLGAAVTALKAVPETDIERLLVRELTYTALKTGLHRHAGKYRDSFASGGKKTVAMGRDLTALKYAVGTGGALTRLGVGAELIEEVFATGQKYDLLPPALPKILIDSKYIMASLGVLSTEYPEDGVHLFKHYLEDL
ncbi:glutamate mutase L [Oceanispirochaeta sp. M2]|nr:glutamate mutase L [Oceanispirochaeta sp. M2]NPD72276.1 DNA mismatch repair protein MutL [Oceanispirochaeta sp. M1]RDG32393.1 DNA mismatch repair protein MutL [Oceanispirochaeta sp. M1]